MPKDDALYVGHMLDMARKAAAKASLVTRTEYDRNGDRRSRETVTPATQRAHPEIPWAEIIGMRHKIVHDYLSLDEDILWNVVTVDLPPVVTALERLLKPQK